MINKFTTLHLRTKILIIAFIILLLAGMVASLRILNNTNDSPPQEQPLVTVTLVPASQLSTNNTTLTVTGILRNKSEADLRSEVPGRITGVYVKVGQWVKSGTLIAEVENDAQRAQVTQALGALEAARAQAKGAEAQLAKVLNGATQEDKNIVSSQVSASEASLDSSYDAARNALQAAYAGTSNAISFSADTMLQNPSSVVPTLTFQTTEYSAKISTENMRVAMGDILSRQASISIQTLYNGSSLDAEISKTLLELSTAKQFTDTILTALDGAITTASVPNSVISSYIATMSTARSQLLGNISALTSAQSAITSTKRALTTVKENEDKLLTNARPEDVASATANADAANASVTTALGSYQAAVAGLEKTRIRAPISGTLSSFSARHGDFINTSQLGRMIGSGGSEVVFYIPSTDNERVSIGDSILVSGSITGHITSIASSTSIGNNQLEVRADLTSKSNLPNGSAVNINILAFTDDEDSKANDTTTELLIPINAIKFNVEGVNVFTVADTVSKIAELIPIDISIGDVLGSMVMISGISKDTLIITDARGLSAGQIVNIKLLQSLKK